LRAALTDVEQMLDQHAERRAPVADVALADHLVARELEHARERVADDRRAQMADVHLLRDVRRGVIDDDAILDGRERHAEALVAGNRLEAALEERRLQREVEEARPCDLDALANVGEVGRGDDGLRDLPRRPLQRFREPHRKIGLKICALGAAHRCADGRVLGAESFADGVLKACREHGPGIAARGRHGTLLAEVECGIKDFSTTDLGGRGLRSIRRDAPVTP
jgi:hypothetical protein